MVNYISNLQKLENLSIQISDLIYENKFTEIPALDKRRRFLIEKISQDINLDKNKFFSNMIIQNEELISNSVKKIAKIKSKHLKFKNIFQAYSSSK